MSAGESFEDIVENFELFDDWEDRYRYVIEIGRAMPELPTERRTGATKVEGCASQVWLVPELHASADGARLFFQGDSDAMIVRGLIALLFKAYSGAPAGEIVTTPPDFVNETGLGTHLSQTRANGLAAMVKQMKMYAAVFQAMQKQG